MSVTLVSREDWLIQRKALLEREKAFTKERDALSAARRGMPLVLINYTYEFDTTDGTKSLSDLFKGKSQLITNHFMFGPDWQEGCPSCSFFSDSYDRAVEHLAARDTAFVTVSNAPLDVLLGYRDRLGWTFDWVSAVGTTFGRDFGVTFEADEMDGTGYNYGKRPYGSESPGLSTFVKLADGRIAHSYSCYGRGLDILNTAYNLLDLTHKGRDEDELPYPMGWVQRRDTYSR